MHASSLQKWHVFHESIMFVKHHQMLASVLLIAALIVSMFGMADYLASLHVSESDRGVFMPGNPFSLLHPTVPSRAHVTNVSKALSYIEDPEYAHELETRTDYITQHLEHLKHQMQADKVYVVSYRYGTAGFGSAVRISKTFEAGAAGIMAPVHVYEGLSRMSWLLTRHYDENMTNSLTLPAPLPRMYGVELYDENQRAIGYLGADYLQEKTPVSGVVADLLQQTANVIEAGFLQPIDSLQGR